MPYFYLIPMLGGPGSARYPITDQLQLVGRSERAEIALLEPTVSRRHATLQCEGGRVVLKDLGSKHGTFVNSKRVSHATLKVGDIVVFGLSLVLRLESSDEPLPAVEAERLSSPNDFVADDVAITAIRTMTIPPSHRKGTTPPEIREDIGRIQNQMAKVHKLAATGAACAQQLPEIGTRLGAVREKVAALADGFPELQDALAALDEVVGSVHRLNHSLSLLPRRRLEPTVLAEVVETAVAETATEAAGRKIRVAPEVAPDLLATAEAHRLGHAVTELIRNAIRHSPEDATVQVLGARRGNEVSLSVIDGGEGFPGDILESACDPFVTRSGEWEALGLGLFEARQIVMSCGGSLQIDSRPGVTSVRLLLPASR
jgi:signal transduction histidine kinase